MNINVGHENYAQYKFYVYVYTDATADAASCWTLAAFRLTLKRADQKSECILNIVEVVPKEWQFKKHQNCIVLMQLHLMLKIIVSDAQWLAPWILFETFCSKIFGSTLPNVYNMPHTFYLVIQP